MSACSDFCAIPSIIYVSGMIKVKTLIGPGELFLDVEQTENSSLSLSCFGFKESPFEGQLNQE